MAPSSTCTLSKVHPMLAALALRAVTRALAARQTCASSATSSAFTRGRINPTTLCCTDKNQMSHSHDHMETDGGGHGDCCANGTCEDKGGDCCSGGGEVHDHGHGAPATGVYIAY